MENTSSRVRTVVMAGGVFILVIMAIPVIALLAVVARPLAALALVAAVVIGGVAVIASRSFRRWLGAKSAGSWTYSGFTLPEDVGLSPGHSWARLDGDVVIGADDLAQAALGPVEAIDLPRSGRHVERGEPLFRLRRGARSIDFGAPMSGTVVRGNSDLDEHPEWVNEDPFGRGWAVRMRADRAAEEGRQLIQGRAARTWFQAEIDGFIRTLSSPQALSLPDGGTIVSELYRHIDEEAWRRLSETTFSGSKS